MTADASATRIHYSAGLYYQTFAAQFLAGLGRIDIAHLRAGDSEITPAVVMRTLAPPRRRSAR